MSHHSPKPGQGHPLAQQLQTAARPEHHTTGIAATRDFLEIPESDTPEEKGGFWQSIKKLFKSPK